MNHQRKPSSEQVQDTAVIGVVIAGVLVSFTIPGPFDWGSSLIGVILLVVLLAYGAKPWDLSFRRAVGMAAAAAFCVLQIVGRPLDYVVDPDRDGNGERRLSGWPHPPIARDADVPDPNGGWELGVLWLLLFLGIMAPWLVTHGEALVHKPRKGREREDEDSP